MQQNNFFHSNEAKKASINLVFCLQLITFAVVKRIEKIL